MCVRVCANKFGESYERAPGEHVRPEWMEVKLSIELISSSTTSFYLFRANEIIIIIILSISNSNFRYFRSKQSSFIYIYNRNDEVRYDCVRYALIEI